LFKSLAAYDPQKGAFTTWLHRITINYCLGERRKRRISTLPLDREGHGASAGFLEMNQSGMADRDAIWQAIGQLSQKQRAVIVLRYYWDLPYAEIAQILAVPLGTVKSRIDLALRTLRAKMSGQPETCRWDPSSEEVIIP